MPKIKKPTERMTAYMENLAKGMRKKDAAISAGYSRSTAHNAHRAIEMQWMFKKLAYANYRHNSQAFKAAFKLSEGLEAQKIVRVPIYEIKDGIRIRLRGQYSYEKVPDHRIQIKYLELAFRILGY